MGNSNIDNRRIAKNTLYMYIRMFVTLGISLYTARVIIQSLGIDDFGIYNLVGGIVIIFSFINNSLKNAFQRFISYELGCKNINNVHVIFGTSINIVALFAILFFIAAETIGLWFITAKLNIPSNRLNAALWVYQFSVITFMLNLFQAPFQAAVVSYEKFSFYAVYSIVDVVLKLIIAFLIVAYDGDKLICYGILVSILSIVSLVAIAFYTNVKLKVPYYTKLDHNVFKSIFSYSGWTMMNSSTVVVAQQGGNILLNIFNGVIANGAYGIANQVSAAVNGFVSNFQSAFNPQIVKSFAAKEYDGMFRLINRSCLFSFYLLFIITIPFFIQCDYLLGLWLGEIPAYAAGFCQLMLIYFLIDASQAPLWMLIYATGEVKVYQIWSGVITILNIPIAALLLNYGYSIYWVFIIRAFLNFCCAVFRTFFVKYLVPEFSVLNYTRKCILPILRTIIFILIIVWAINKYLDISPFLKIFSGIILSASIIWCFGIAMGDRSAIINVIKNQLS